MISELGKAIESEYKKLLAALLQVPNRVNAADLIAYQIGWGKLLIGWYEAGIKGEMHAMPGEGFMTWDYTGLAQHFYKKYAYDRAEVQEQEFKRVVQAILKIVEKEHQIGNLDRIGVWPWCTLKSGKPWTLQKWIQVNTVAPYKRAIKHLRKQCTDIVRDAKQG